MDDERTTKNMEKNLSGQSLTDISYDSSVFQPIWVRRSSIWSDIMDRKFMESQLRVVLCCGLIFWTIYLLSQIV